jgi:hypothetical protein
VTTAAQLNHFLVRYVLLDCISPEAEAAALSMVEAEEARAHSMHDIVQALAQPMAEAHRQDEHSFIQAQLQPMARAMVSDAIETLAASISRNPQYNGIVENQKLRHLCTQALSE